MHTIKHINQVVFVVFTLGALLIAAPPSWAGLDDCLEVALDTANPQDMESAANFAIRHPS